MPENNQHHESEETSWIQAIIITVIALAVCVVYIAGTGALGIERYWVGLFFLWYIAQMENLTMIKLRNAILGGFTGMAVCGLLSVVHNEALHIGIIAVLIIVLVSHKVPAIVNQSTLLFFNIFILDEFAFTNAVVDGSFGLVAGVAFFGSIFALVVYMRQRNAQTASQESA